MQRLLFIGFNYHLKTGSADFLIELIEQRYEVTTCWVDLYSESPYFGFSDVVGDYDVLICWQVMPPRAELSKHFTFRHATFFPMQDGCPSRKRPEMWYPYRDFQIICFSSGLFRQLKSAGLSAHYIQYFPQPVPVENWGSSDSAFFWARREEINCDLVQKLLSTAGLTRMHVHNSPDPGVRFVPASNPDSIEYSYSVWFEDKAELDSKILESAFYISPRKKEGIGMSFLEAMARGRCVVAPNNATMNEYIEHGKTGCLYNFKRPKSLNVREVGEIQRRAHRYITRGFALWQKRKVEIFDWIVAPVEIKRFRIFLRMSVRFFRNPMKVVRVLKNEYSS